MSKPIMINDFVFSTVTLIEGYAMLYSQPSLSPHDMRHVQWITFIYNSRENAYILKTSVFKHYVNQTNRQGIY